MESTFIIKREDLNKDFIDVIKKLFSQSKQLQITINTSEDFGLLHQESGYTYLQRLKKAAEDMEHKRSIVKIPDSELDKMVLSRL